MRILVLLYHFLFPPPPVPAGKDLQALLDNLVRAEASPGLAAAWWRRGAAAPVQAASGQAQWQAGTPLRTDSSFLWFSLTKLVTATALMQLIEEGRAGLDTPLLEVLPELAGRAPYLKGITLRHLLSHTSGLRDGPPFLWYRTTHLAGEAGMSTEKLLAILLPEDGSLRRRPGAAYAYANANYFLLGLVLERLGGRPYEEQVRSRLLGPLGMRHTDFVHLDVDRAAWGHERVDSLETWLGRKFLTRMVRGGRMGVFGAVHLFYVDQPAVAGLVGPVGDLWKFGDMHLNGGVHAGKRFLRPESVALMQQDVLDGEGRALGAGLGWRLGSYKGERFVHHLGSGGGYRSELRLYPGRGLGVATLANVQGAGVERVAEAVLEEEAAKQALPAPPPAIDQDELPLAAPVP